MITKSMSKNLVASLCLLLVSTTGVAQTEKGKGNLFKKIESIASRNMVHGVDTNYVKTPSRPWQVSIRTRVAQTDLDMHSRIDGERVFDGTFLNPQVKGTGVLETDPRFITQVSTSLGVKVGYRGLSASYSFHIGGQKGQSIALKSAGSWYSLNMRWHRFKMTTPTIRFAGQMLVRDDEQSPWSEVPESYEFKDRMPLESPIKISTLMFDGFYIFNRKKFSYAAAYTQKTFQVRSAGSFLAGLTAYYADFDYSNKRNADFFAAMDDIGRLRQYQVSVGAGYAYNFVPAKGWILSAMFMPTMTVLNRTKVNTYQTNYKEVDEREWEYEEDYADKYEVISKESHSHNNRIALNFNARVSITYNWDRYFINANGQFDNNNFRHSGLRGHLNDWYINASVGVRL